MNESLLAHEVDHGEEDDELLWNELKDDHHHHDAQHHHSPSTHDDRAHRHHLPSASALGGGRRGGAASTGAPLPSLRAHVHLPAISTLFHNVLDSAKNSFSRSSTAAAPNASGQSPPSSPPTPSSSTLRTSHAPDANGAIQSLDGFLISLYNHFYHKGFWATTALEVVALVTGLFSVTLSSFVVGCVQWQQIIARNHNRTAYDADLEDFVTCRPDDSSSIAAVLSLFYFVMFLCYWLFRAFGLIRTLQDAHDMSAFYRDRLLIDERQLQTVKWDDVVTRVLALVQPPSRRPLHAPMSSSYYLQIDPTLLATPHDFARRIMRRENYLIAFLNHSLFANESVLPARLAQNVHHVMFSRNMECNLSICLIDELFDRELQLSHAFVRSPELLAKRFVVAGVINLVLTPFILLYRVSHYCFQVAMAWHLGHCMGVGTRRWSAYALWQFREYNELPHVLDARMERSLAAADRYLSRFPAGVSAIVAGGISFCASSLLAVLLVLSLVDESLVWTTTLYGMPLFGYGTIATLMFSFARTFTTTKSPLLVTNGDSEEAMMELAAETHYFPTHWRGRCETFAVRDEFVGLFPFRLMLLLQEVLSVVLAPYLLCVALPRLARDILLFVRAHTLVSPTAGAVCRFAEFDFDAYGHDNKMEKSFVNFKQNHPQWVGATAGEALVTKLQALKESELDKSMRMGDTMLFNGHGGLGASQSHLMGMSLSQQLLQSQAIHTALGGYGGSVYGMAPQDSEFYWLEKFQQQGRLDEYAEQPIDDDNRKRNDATDASISISSLR